MIAMVPVLAAAQQFLPSAGPPVDPNVRFEVVAIKALNGASGSVLMRAIPGRYESSVQVGVLLRQALQKPDYQIVGAPGWIDTERYSITAKIPDGLPPTAISVLLLNLLRDRFQLATRLETRELPIFNLVMARPDGRLGPDLKPTSGECQATIAERVAASQAAAAGREQPAAAAAVARSQRPTAVRLHERSRWPCGGHRSHHHATRPDAGGSRWSSCHRQDRAHRPL